MTQKISKKYYIAQIMSFIWAIYWTSSCLIFALSLPRLSKVDFIIITIISTLILMGPIILTQWKKNIGAVILLLESLFGLCITVVAGIIPLVQNHPFPLEIIIFLFLILTFPPLLSGILLLLSRRTKK